MSSVKFADKTIEFTLKISNRRKSIGISITPKREVIVSVPKNSRLETIEQIVQKKAVWINSKLNYIEKLVPQNKSKEFKNEEKHMYMGKELELKVLTSANDRIDLTQNNLLIYSKQPDNELYTKHLLTKWYWEQSKKIFNERVTYLFEKFNIYNLKTPTMSVERMTKKWGECSSTGHIKLNKELIKMPEECIDYVITHELCHLLVQNHSSNFYKVLNKHYPKWKIIKARLKDLSFTTID